MSFLFRLQKGKEEIIRKLVLWKDKVIWNMSFVLLNRKTNEPEKIVKL